MIPDPIFKVKKDVDLFKLYGPKKKTEVKSGNLADNVEDATDDLQSIRIKLAVMKAKEQCEETEDAKIRQEAIDEVDSNLREIIELESPPIRETKAKMPNVPKAIPFKEEYKMKSISKPTKSQKEETNLIT